jgi:hypothetical protein
MRAKTLFAYDNVQLLSKRLSIHCDIFRRRRRVTLRTCESRQYPPRPYQGRRDLSRMLFVRSEDLRRKCTKRILISLCIGSRNFLYKRLLIRTVSSSLEAARTFSMRDELRCHPEPSDIDVHATLSPAPLGLEGYCCSASVKLLNC